MAERLMKDSGIEWANIIPNNWDVMPNKRIMKKRKDICEKYDGEDIISLTMDGVIIRNLEDGGKMPISFDGYQRIIPGNLLMCLFDYDVTPRCIGLIKNYGLTSPAYSQFEMLNNNYSPYYYYYYLMLDNTKELLHLAKNLRHSFTEEQLGEIYTPVPPIEEQTRIADFLDKKVSQIDNVITKTKQSIEEYKKLKQSIITEAVTKGLNPDVKMKDSGIGWIGKIPADWNKCKIKSSCKLITGSTPSTKNDEYFNGNIKWFTPGDFNDKYYLNESERTLSERAKIDNVMTIIPKNTVMIVGIGATAGKIGYVANICSCNQQITGLINNEKLESKFLMYWMIANTKFLRETAMYTTLPILNNETIGSYLLICPKSKKEQNQIISYLDKQCSKYDDLISKKEKIVEELEQYKKSLIYEYVTGKKEVA